MFNRLTITQANALHRTTLLLFLYSINNFPIVRNNTDTIPSGSLIKQESLETLNGRLLSHLQAGNTITFIEAMKMGTGNLHSRIPELKAAGIPIYSRFIKVGRIDCRECSLLPFNNSNNIHQ